MSLNISIVPGEQAMVNHPQSKVIAMTDFLKIDDSELIVPESFEQHFKSVRRNDAKRGLREALSYVVENGPSPVGELVTGKGWNSTASGDRLRRLVEDGIADRTREEGTYIYFLTKYAIDLLHTYGISVHPAHERPCYAGTETKTSIDNAVTEDSSAEPSSEVPVPQSNIELISTRKNTMLIQEASAQPEKNPQNSTTDLLSKLPSLPEFDPNWPQGVQESWFKSYQQLIDMAKK